MFSIKLFKYFQHVHIKSKNKLFLYKFLFHFGFCVELQSCWFSFNKKQHEGNLINNNFIWKHHLMYLFNVK